jgi:hypothetical protein
VTGRTTARADLWSALGWIGLGGAIVAGAWRMDRLERLNVNPYTAPGLVPGLLGIGIALMGVILLVRSLRARGWRAAPPVDPMPALPWGRLALALALCLGFAAGLLGRGLPFWLTSGLFVFLAVLAFDGPRRRAEGEAGRGVLVALAVAAGAAAGITLVFQEVFLVRLP